MTYTLVPRWRARTATTPLERQMSRLFSDFLGDSNERELWNNAPNKLGNFLPNIDMSESEKEVIVKAELPGMEVQDVNVSIKDNILTLTGEKKYEYEGKEGEVNHIERAYGKFERTIQLPAVDEDKIDAAMNCGVLTIKLPKALEAKGTRKVSIRKG